MTNPKEIEAEFAFYQDKFLNRLKVYHDDEDFNLSWTFATAIAEALGAMALYHSSKRLET